MDYEKKYKHALDLAKQVHDTTISKQQKENIETIFPELAGSKDEKVRKWIYNYFRSLFPTWIHPDITCEEILAWLEKQGTSYTKRDVDDAYVEGMAFAKYELEKKGEQKHALDIEIPFGAKDSELQEATYLIPEGFHAEIEGDKVVIKKGKQKPAIWREEDERMYSIVFEEYKNRQYYSHPTLEDYDISGQILGWLKSLKDRVQPQPKHEWSEEDETGWTNTMIMIKECASNHYTKDSIKLVVDWLESIKERYTWKPSDEQMEALEHFIIHHNGSTNYAKDLEELRIQLKKLKGE